MICFYIIAIFIGVIAYAIYKDGEDIEEWNKNELKEEEELK